MSADLLREAAALMRERAGAAVEPWGVERWRHSLSALPDAKYRVAPAWEKHAVTTDDEHGSIILTTPWQQDTAPVVHAASWHPAVALAVADWLDKMANVAATETAPVAVRLAFTDEAVKIARAYLGRES